MCEGTEGGKNLPASELGWGGVANPPAGSGAQVQQICGARLGSWDSFPAPSAPSTSLTPWLGCTRGCEVKGGSKEGGASWCVFLDLPLGICPSSSSDTMATRLQLREPPGNWATTGRGGGQGQGEEERSSGARSGPPPPASELASRTCVPQPSCLRDRERPSNGQPRSSRKQVPRPGSLGGRESLVLS